MAKGGGAVWRRPVAAPTGRRDRSSAGQLLAPTATAASIRSLPMSPSNFAQTGFIASTQAWRCVSVDPALPSAAEVAAGRRDKVVA